MVKDFQVLAKLIISVDHLYLQTYIQNNFSHFARGGESPQETTSSFRIHCYRTFRIKNKP